MTAEPPTLCPGPDAALGLRRQWKAGFSDLDLMGTPGGRSGPRPTLRIPSLTLPLPLPLPLPLLGSHGFFLFSIKEKPTASFPRTFQNLGTRFLFKPLLSSQLTSGATLPWGPREGGGSRGHAGQVCSGAPAPPPRPAAGLVQPGLARGYQEAVSREGIGCGVWTAMPTQTPDPSSHRGHFIGQARTWEGATPPRNLEMGWEGRGWDEKRGGVGGSGGGGMKKMKQSNKPRAITQLHWAPAFPALPAGRHAGREPSKPSRRATLLRMCFSDKEDLGRGSPCGSAG